MISRRQTLLKPMITRRQTLFKVVE